MTIARDLAWQKYDLVSRSWGRMSITDTKPFMLPVTRHSIFGHKLPVTNSLA